MVKSYRKVINWQRLLQDGLLIEAGYQPEKDAVVVENCHYSYTRLLQDASKVARWLQNRGVKKGDRVAIYMENTWPCIVSIYATLLCGCVFVLINPQTKTSKLKYILDNCEACILVASHTHHLIVAEVGSKSCLSSILFCGEFDEHDVNSSVPFDSYNSVVSTISPSFAHVNIIPNDLAAIIYTSGSTGFPKGVMQTHLSMVFAAWSIIEYLQLSGQDRILLVLPISFDYGLYQLLMSISLGATLVVEQSFTYPAHVYQRIIDAHVSVFPGVPTIFAMMLSANRKKKIQFPSVAKVTNTAAALPTNFILGIHDLFPNALIYSMYGLTECKRVSYLKPKFLNAKPGSVGQAIPGTEVYLRTIGGDDVPENEVGILHVRGQHVMAGYWNNPKLTEKMLVPGKLPGERVLCTQDLFRMDKDGFLYFVGRNDDIIKSHGEKVSPLEIENILYALPGVRQAAVIGIADDILGESIVAFIALEESAGLNIKNIKRHCVLNLENFMVPHEVVILDELPISANGKINKVILKKIAVA